MKKEKPIIWRICLLTIAIVCIIWVFYNFMGIELPMIVKYILAIIDIICLLVLILLTFKKEK